MRNLHTASTLSSVAYVVSGVISSFLGRIIVTRFFFDYPIVILLLQNAVILFVIEALRMANILKMSPYSFEKGRHLFIPSILFCISQWLTVSAFEGIGLPVFDSVKRIAPLFILLISAYTMRQNKFDRTNLGAVILITFVSFLTVNFELSLDRFSLFYGFVAAVAQAVAFVQFEQLAQNFQASELLYINSFNSIIIFLLADIVQDELRDAFMYMMTSSHPLFNIVLMILFISALPLHYIMFSCIEQNGALNTQILSNIRASVQVFIAYYLSIYLFYDITPTILNYFGLIAIFPAAYYYYMRTKTEANIPWTAKA